jgi:hypothetical protein
MKNRRERRKESRQSLASQLGLTKLSQLGFFYKGAGITVTDRNQINFMLQIYQNAIPGYQQAILHDKNEIDYLLSQNQYVIDNYLDKNILPPTDEATIFMMNVYALTKLGYMTNDNMNGLQYGYTK